MILLCLSFSISLLTGFLLASLIPSWQKKSCNYLLLRISLAVGLGFGISSSLYFIHLFFGPSTASLALMETLLLVSLLFVHFSRTGANLTIFEPDKQPATSSIYRKILLAGFSCTFVSAFLTFVLRSLILPYGSWDAWQTWNFFARFLYRGENRWNDAFSTLLNLHHPDYPLLIPSTIARCWQYIGNETQVVPVITAGLFTFASIGLLFSSLSILKDRSQALLAGTILAGTPNFVILGSMQYADVPLGFFFLSAIVLFAFRERMPENQNIPLLAGTMAGFSCWTKNEGFLFLLALLLAQLVTLGAVDSRKRNVKSLMLFFAGTAPVMTMVLFFKCNLAPANEIFTRQEFPQTLSKLVDISRYLHVMKSFFLISSNKFPIMLLMAFYFFYLKVSFKEKDKRTFIVLPLTLLLMLAGYFFVYVITPYDLDWHLDTSLHRLMMQLWPSIIFTFSLLTHTPEEALARTRNI